MYSEAIGYGNAHILYFESLKENLTDNLTKILKFLKKNNADLDTR